MSIFVRAGGLKNYYKNSPVTSIIIVLNLIMIFVTFIYGGFDSYTLLRLGALWSPLLIEDQEWWRLITSMFLHGSISHFIGNAIIGLYFLSGALERTIGSKKFLMIYLISGLGAGLLVIYTTNALTIGASGAIFGALGSLLYIGIYRKDLMSVQDFKSIQGLVVVNIIFTFLRSNISIPGHIGGILTGFLLSYLLIRKYSNNEDDYNRGTDFKNERYDPYDNYNSDPWGDN